MLGRQTTELRSLKVIYAILAVSIVSVAAIFGGLTYRLVSLEFNENASVGVIDYNYAFCTDT